ncbi:hypothetical protein HPB51_017358 [Rhipicephalus microplus]|uniref:Uncharacterized protein n=1 Tax=Rhipicephalus microplus TaxID=6941 RepID=A0A9J6DAX4_RHIMP|nr:hypothetical protein HPB51_017358 [Rhipicephalus microplus]
MRSTNSSSGVLQKIDSFPTGKEPDRGGVTIRLAFASAKDGPMLAHHIIVRAPTGEATKWDLDENDPAWTKAL